MNILSGLKTWLMSEVSIHDCHEKEWKEYAERLEKSNEGLAESFKYYVEKANQAERERKYTLEVLELLESNRNRRNS